MVSSSPRSSRGCRPASRCRPPTSTLQLARRRLGARPGRPDVLRAGRGHAHRRRPARPHAGRPDRDPGRQHRVAEVVDGHVRRPGRRRRARRPGAQRAADPPAARATPTSPGMQKYGFDDARPVLERASARETAARVALGAVAAGVPAPGASASRWSATSSRSARSSCPTACCPARTTTRASTRTRCAAPTRPPASAWSPRSTTSGRTATPSAGSSRSSSTACRRAWAATCTGTAGWTRGWPAPSWACSRSRRSRSATVWRPRAAAARWPTTRSSWTDGPACSGCTDRAGGIEGGMTNGEVLRVRAAMKPISTVPRALATDRHRHARARRRHQPAQRRLRGAPRQRRHGGDGGPRARRRRPGEVRRRLGRPRPGATPRPTSTPCRSDERPRSLVLVGPPASGKTTVGHGAGRRARARPSATPTTTSRSTAGC